MAIIDLLGRLLDRIMNMNNAHTFDRTTDSLEAISNALGIGPGVGLWMFGRVAAGIASTTVITTDNLGVHLPTDVFNNEFYMQVLHNVDAPGTAPEREIRRITDFVGPTQTFTTDAFSANVEAGDLVAIIHESVLTIEILGFGTLTTSSATVPADNTRPEVDNYFNGCLLMPTEGACRFQPRRIVDYTGAGGIFTLDPNNPFTGVPGLVDYIIIGDQTEFVPAADAVNNRTPSDVIGGKADTAIQTVVATASLARYIKGLITALGDPTGGTLTTITAKWGDIARSLDLILGARWDAAGDLGTDIVAILAALTGATGQFNEQADTAVNITAIVASETDVLNLAVANTRYIVRSLRLKCADPGANTVTVRLYELVNDVSTVVDSFAITNANFATYHSLMDMLGLPHLAGDNLRVTVQASAGGPYAVTGQYSVGKTNV